MMDERIKAMLECGFIPPLVSHVKEDRRGEEYGYYKAVAQLSTVPKDRRIQVLKFDRASNLEWCCSFDRIEYFKAWAMENT